MARIWVKAGTVGTLPLDFKCQGQRTNKDTPILVNADGNVVSKINDGSLVKCRPPYYKETKKKEINNVK